MINKVFFKKKLVKNPNLKIYTKRYFTLAARFTLS